jgi:hypothetical protein
MRCRVARLAFATALAALFFLAFWFRVSSLGAFPWHNADESYYGVQTARLLAGKAFATRTINHNVLNPFLVAMQAPFHLIVRPDVWVLRAPAVICNVLVVILTYMIGARVLDRTTALIASMLLAGLPCAIYNSRVGLEMSQLPLFGLIALAFAIRGHGPGLLVSFLASMLVHPSAIFLMPIALPVYLVRLFGLGRSRAVGEPEPRRGMPIVPLLVALGVVVAVSLIIFNHPVAQVYIQRRPKLHWLHFLDGYERVLFFRYIPFSKLALGLHRWGFRGLVLALIVLGTRGLVRERQWERLALITGLLLSLSIFHFVAGPNMLRSMGTYRYGIVFLLPTVLAFACLLERLRAPGTSTLAGTTRPGLHRLPLVVALVLAWAMLWSVKTNLLDPSMSQDRESLWTFHSDQRDEYERALSLIRRDVVRRRSSGRMGTAGDPPRPTPLIVDDYWALMPLAYLASSSNDFKVVPLIGLGSQGNRSFDDRCAEKRGALEDDLRSGAYAIHRVGAPGYGAGTLIEDTANSAFLPGQVRRWEIPTRPGGVGLIVYRLADGPDRGASRR